MVIPRKHVATLALIVLLAGPLGYMASSAGWLQTWTPGIELFIATPDGYQDTRTFRRTRTHDFAALHDEPPPAPVTGAGHLRRVTDGKPYGAASSGTGRNEAPDVKTLHVERLFGPDIIAHLDIPLDPELREHLQGLRRGAVVTIAGIGHGDGEHNVYVYPVHQVNGHTP